jgi:hypothetical protein
VEIYVICCVTIVAMILLRLRLDVGRMSASEPTIGFTSIEAPARCAENSEVFAPLSCLGFLVDSDFFSPSSNLRERQCKFLSDWQQICCVFNKYLRKYYCETKKTSLLCKKVVDECVIYVIS